MKLNYQFRYCLPLIEGACGDAGLPVFMVIMSHFNSRNRSFPSYDTIQYFTRFSRQSISDAIDGLIELGMLTLVPVDKREENEKEIHGNANVYQGTGCLKIQHLTIVFADFDWESEGLVPSDKNEIRTFIADHFSNPKIKSSGKTQKLVFSLDHKRIQRSLKKGTTPEKEKDSATLPNTKVAHEYEEISLEQMESHETKHSQGAWFMVRSVTGTDLVPPIIQEDLPPALRYLRKKSKRPASVKLAFALDPQSKAVYQYVDAKVFFAYFAPIDGTPMRYSWELSAKERRFDAIGNMWRGAQRSLNTLDVTTLHTLWQRQPNTYAPSKIITALDAIEQETILQAQAQHEQAQFVTVYTEGGAIQLHKEHDAATIEALRKEGIAIHDHQS